ncbi:hypothetical protein [Kitasatospora sp. NPDC057541]|uniref:hypothetical protein n=1 Tax=unclassified Kitasatospora TaxID=2633591 RepID=UPI00368700E8
MLRARLSVFAGGFDADAAEYVCAGAGIDPDELPGLLTGLVARSALLRERSPHGVRFRLPDAGRADGRRRLRAAGEERRLRRRHRDWYLGVATWGEVEWFGPRQAETAERTALVHADLRAALEFCLSEPGEQRTALLLAGTLWFYWAGCGHPAEGRRWLERALALDPEPTEARATALWATGWTAALQGDPAAARAALEECRRQALATGDDRALARAVHRQGCAALTGDRPARAAELFEEALRRYRAVGELDSNVLLAMVGLGTAQLRRGDRERGELRLGRARELCERYGEQWAYAYGLHALAYARWLNGEIRPARTLARESVRLHRRFNDRAGIGPALDLLARLEGGPLPPGNS